MDKQWSRFLFFFVNYVFTLILYTYNLDWKTNLRSRCIVNIHKYFLSSVSHKELILIVFEASLKGCYCWIIWFLFQICARLIQPCSALHKILSDHSCYTSPNLKTTLFIQYCLLSHSERQSWRSPGPRSKSVLSDHW